MLAQRDPKWANVKLGSGSASGTIGQFGCLLTAFTDGINSKGWNETPITANTKMNAGGGYVAPASNPNQKNLWVWAAPEKIWSGVVKLVGLEYYKAIPADLTKLASYINQGFVILLEVSATGIGGTGSHFVRALRVEGNNVIISDPWYAEEAQITKRYIVGNVDTASEIILTFAIYNISTNPNNMSTQTDLEVCLSQHTQLMDKIQKELEPALAQSKIDLDAAKKTTSEIAGQLQAANETSDSRKKKYDNFIQYLANKLGCAGDEDVIKGSIEELLLVEDKLTKAEDTMKQMQIDNDAEKKGFQTQIETLKEEVRLAHEDYNKISDKLTDLEKEIQHAQEIEEKVNKLMVLITNIKTWFTDIFTKEEEKPVDTPKTEVK